MTPGKYAAVLKLSFLFCYMGDNINIDLIGLFLGLNELMYAKCLKEQALLKD